MHSTLTPNADTLLRAFYRRRVVGMGGALAAVIAVALWSGKIALWILAGILILALADAIYAIRTQRRSATISVSIATTVLVMAAFVVNLPAEVFLVPMVVVMLEAVIFLRSRRVIQLILYLAIGLPVAIGAGSLLIPRSWDRTEAAVLGLAAAAASLPALLFLFRALAASVGETSLLSERLDRSHRQLSFQASLLDQARSAVIASDREGSITYANAYTCELTGHDPSELTGRSLREVFIPEWAYDDLDRVMDELRAHDSWEGEFPIQRRDGSVFSAHIIDQVLRDEDGASIGVVTVGVDLTPVKAAEAERGIALDMLDQVRNAVITTDLDGTVTYWNHEAERLYGWIGEEVIGKPVTGRTIPPESAPHAAEVIRSILATGSWSGEIEAWRKDGSRFPALLTESAIYGADGKPTAIVGISTDISELRRVQAEAHKLGELARSVLRSVHFPVAVIDRDGRITTVNQAWRTFALNNGGDLTKCGEGANYLDVATESAARDPSLREIPTGIRRVLAGELDEFRWDYECHSPNEQRWFKMEVNPIVGGGAVISHWDITDAHRVQQALEDLIRSKDEFLASISHELRTPLTAVIGLTEELAERSDSFQAEEIAEFHKMIAEQSREVGYIVEDLLVAARADIDLITIRPTPVELGEVVTGLTGLTVPHADIRNPDPVWAWADPVRTRQIVRNLLTNAARYGGPHVLVSVEARDNEALLIVEDDGEGIPQAEQTRVFDPYYQAQKRPGLPDSVGLGLFVSLRLAELMGGSLSYRYQGRSIFELRLPLSPTDPS